VNVGALFGDGEFGDNGWRGDDIGEAQTGGDDFGEAAAVDDPAVFVEGFERGQGVAAIAQVAVRVVFKYCDVVAAGQVVNGLAFGQGCGDAGWVLEVGDDVDEAGARIVLESLFQGGNVHTVVEEFDADQIDAVGAEGVEGADEGGGFADDGVAFVAKAAGGEIQGLLGAGDDQALVWGDRGHGSAGCCVGEDFSLGDKVGDGLAQGAVAFADGILQRQGGGFGHNRGHDAAEGFGRERLGGGVAGGQGDDAGVGGGFEDFADGGGLQSGYSVGEGVVHEVISFFGLWFVEICVE